MAESTLRLVITPGTPLATEAQPNCPKCGTPLGVFDQVTKLPPSQVLCCAICLEGGRRLVPFHLRRERPEMPSAPTELEPFTPEPREEFTREQHRSTIGMVNDLADFVMSRLPEGWEIRLRMWNGSVGLELIDPYDDEVHVDFDGDASHIITLIESAWDAEVEELERARKVAAKQQANRPKWVGHLADKEADRA